MRRLLRAYDRIIDALPVISGALVLVITASIVLDVVLRELAIQPPAWTSALVEYGLLYMTMLAAPWLVREHGHIVVDSLKKCLPSDMRRPLDRAVALICATTSLVIVFYGTSLAVTAWVNNDYDIRSVSIPYWVFYSVIPIGFLFASAEFLMQAIGLRDAPPETS